MQPALGPAFKARPCLSADGDGEDGSEEGSGEPGKKEALQLQRVVAGRKGGVKEAVAELLRPGGHFSQVLQEETGVRISEVHEALLKVLSSVKKDTVRRHIGEFVHSNYLRRGDNHVFFAGDNWRSWGGNFSPQTCANQPTFAPTAPRGALSPPPPRGTSLHVQ